LADINGEKEMLKKWLERVEKKLDAVIMSNAEKNWHGNAIRGLIAAVAGIGLAAIAHMLGIR